MKKKFMGIALVLTSAFITGNVYADGWTKEKGYGVVTDATNADAYITAPTYEIATNTGVEKNTITYTAGEFKLVEGGTNTAGTRDAGNSWVGVKVTVPNSANDQYKVYVDGTLDEEGLRTNKTDYTEWFGVSEKRLNATVGGQITRTLQFDWNNDGTKDQTVTIIIKTMNISLYPLNTTTENKATTTPIWSPTIAENKLAAKKAAAAAQKEAEELAAEQAKVAEVVSVVEDGVKVSGTNISKEDTTYKTMLEKATEKGYKTVFGAYELTKVEGTIGDKGITLTFNVGKDNEGKAALVLHKKADGTYEEFNEVVKNGVVKVTVKELSPFMIALGEVIKDDAPETSDAFSVALVGIIALGFAGAYTFKKLHN